MVLNKLIEWERGAEGGRVRRVLEAAMKRYAGGVDPITLEASIEGVKQALTPDQRRAALNDLIQIANADGLFLDNEEDLLNELTVAWEVVPPFGDHGTKDARALRR